MSPNSHEDTGLLAEFAEDYEHQEGAEFYLTTRNWPLFYHTAKNMTATQLTGIIERKLRHAVLPRLPVDFDQWYEASIPDNLAPKTEPLEANNERLRSSLTESERANLRKLVSDVREGRFTFLNHTIEFEDDIDWDHPEMDDQPLMWRLKLQSFAHLEWVVLANPDSGNNADFIECLEKWLADWEEQNPIGQPDYLRQSWIPHSVALRILNLSRYLAWRNSLGHTDDTNLVARLIFKNALFLENHIEYEVGGNHLIENGIALLVAGVLFQTERPSWIALGRRILTEAGNTQFLEDGCHFERSPMYHVMVLRRFITASDLLRGSEHELGLGHSIVQDGLGFLQEISKPDGEIPLLNDSVHGEQLSAAACLEYGRNCSIQPHSRQSPSSRGSGYKLLENEFGVVLVDVGRIGPPHLPAHSHNDHLSVLLWADDEPILTDTGVYDYAPTIRRQYSRSVQAHNTAQFDSIEPIQTGGRYLMGKRNSPTVLDEDDNFIEATYTRDGVLGQRYTHQRSVSMTNSSARITDFVSSNSAKEVTIRYHFAPPCDIEQVQDSLLVEYGDASTMRFEFEGAVSITVTESPIFERYGEESSRPAIELATSANNEISTVIRHANGGI